MRVMFFPELNFYEVMAFSLQLSNGRFCFFWDRERVEFDLNTLMFTDT